MAEQRKTNVRMLKKGNRTFVKKEARDYYLLKRIKRTERSCRYGI